MMILRKMKVRTISATSAADHAVPFGSSAKPLAAKPPSWKSAAPEAMKNHQLREQ